MTTKLLAVDDSKTMRKVLEITFSGDKFDSTVVGSASEALQALHTLGPQIAVVDGAMGAVNGYDLCKQIKSEAPNVKILLLSSKQRPYDEAQGSVAGVDDHFDKPYDSTKFLDRVIQLAASAAAQAVAPPVAQAVAPPAAQAPQQRPPAPPSRISEESPVGAPATAVSSASERQAAPNFSEAESPRAMPEPIRVEAPSTTEAAVPPSDAAATAIANAGAGMPEKLKSLGLTSDQVQAVLSLSREIVEQVVWEVVPTLAETLIKEEIARLTSD